LPAKASKTPKEAITWGEVVVTPSDHTDLTFVTLPDTKLLRFTSLTLDEWRLIERAIRGHGQKQPLTPMQRLVLYSLNNYIEGSGRVPSVRELSGVFGRSPATIQSHLKLLEEKGYIQITGKAYGIIVLE